MASHIVARTQGDPLSARDALDLETVMLWLTPTIERDYVKRGVFPAVRAGSAVVSRANATLHHLTQDQAQALLDDAEDRRLESSNSLKAAFKPHALNLRSSIDEAKGRRAQLEATEPFCVDRDERRERWRGTKEQLRTIGVALEGPYPGEPGGKRRWAQTHDQRGYKVHITNASMTWAGLFLADISVPDYVQSKMKETSKHADAEKERLRRLGTLPTTATAFRESVAKTFWSYVGATKWQMRAEDVGGDGYRFTDEAVEEFMDAVGDAYWILQSGETTGRSPRDKLQQVLLEKAAADVPLQRFLSGLRPGPTH